MTMWGKELNSRESEEKMTVQGRMDAATFKQTMGYLKPLLKMLRKGTLSEDIRDSLSNMVRMPLVACQTEIENICKIRGNNISKCFLFLTLSNDRDILTRIHYLRLYVVDDGRRKP